MTESKFFNILVLAWIGLAIVMIPVLLKVKAPYGRFSSNKWGPMISNRLSWIIMETPSLVFFSLFFLIGTQTKTAVTWVFFACWAGHYFYRSFIFPFRLKIKGKKQPFMIAGNAIFFNFVNGYVNGHYLGTLGPVYELSYFSDPRFIIGICLFLAGMFINQYSDQILMNLRKPGETGYKIPRKGFYKFVSSPNYLGEIIEWTGFAVMVWSLPALSFLIWTAANLMPRALANHKWYKEKFPEYPKNRRAIIPYIL